MGDNGRRLEEIEGNRGAFVEEDSKENGRQWQKIGRDGEKQRSMCRRRF